MEKQYSSELTRANIAYFQKLLEKHRLSHFETELAPCLEPCIGVEVGHADDYSLPGCSRLGGSPDWPEGWEWPMVDNQAETAFAMAFICQINLAELAHLVSPLPRQGLLYVFLDDYEEPVSCQVRYYDGDPASLRPMAAERPLSLCESLLGTPYEQTPAARPHLLQFHSALSLPCSGEFDRIFSGGLDFDQEGFDHFLELGEELMGDWQHYFFGYHFSHESLRDLGESEGELQGLTLLWLNSDEEVGLEFSELGPLHLLIDKERLRQKDFAGVRLAREAE